MGNVKVAMGDTLTIPDHEVVRCVGSGAYGEVWLARNVLGGWRAVKIVSRRHFDDGRPYERELEGLRCFEPISRSHDNLVDILQVGVLRGGESFYYVMELADSAMCEAAGRGDVIQPDIYHARTLRADLRARGYLSFEECVQLGFSLAGALAHLHGHGLVHRDVKPSNIIYVGGIPKLADIGLVAGHKEAKTMVGTMGYMAPEGTNTPQGDVYGLGKLLYECAVGKAAHHYPEPRTDLGDLPDRSRWLELFGVVEKACDPNPSLRYASASEMQADLALLFQAGAFHAARRRSQVMLRMKRLVYILLVAGGLGGMVYMGERRHSAQLSRAWKEGERRLHELAEGHGLHALEREMHGDAALWLAEAMKYHQTTPESLRLQELRLHSTLEFCPRLIGVGEHGSRIRALGFNHRGSHFATASSEGSVRFWDAETGGAVGSELKHAESVEGFEFSPDDKRVLTWSEGRWVQVWDFTTRKQIGPGRELASQVGAAMFTPDGKWVVTGDIQGRIQVWDSEGGMAVRGCSGHSGAVNRICFQPEGRLAATCGDDHVVRLWHVATWDQYGHDMLHGDDVRWVDFSPDGRKLVTACKDGNLRIWDVTTCEPVTDTMSHEVPLWTASFSPDGLWVIGAGGSGSRGGRARIWEAATGRPRTAVMTHEDTIRSACFGPDGQAAVTAGHDFAVGLWNAKTGMPLGNPLRTSGYAKWIALRPGGYRLVVAGDSPDWRCWDISTACSGRRPDTNLPYRSVLYSHSGQFLIGDREDGAVELVHAESLSLIRVLVGGGAPFSRLCLSEDDRMVYGLRVDGSVQVFNLSNGELVCPVLHVDSSPDEGSGIGLSRDGRSLMVWGLKERSLVRIWDLGLGGRIVREIHHPHPVAVAVISPDGSLLATGGGADRGTAYGEVSIWRLSDGSPWIAPHPMPSKVEAIEWSPDGQTLVAACHGQPLELGNFSAFKVQSRQWRNVPITREHITRMEFSANSENLLVATAAGECRVWKLESAEPVSKVFGRGRHCWSTAYRSEQGIIATGTLWSGVSLWDAASFQSLGPALPYSGRVAGLSWRPKHFDLAVYGSTGTRVWKLELPARGQEHWQRQAELATGCRLDSSGSLVRLSGAELIERLRESALYRAE